MLLYKPVCPSLTQSVSHFRVWALFLTVSFTVFRFYFVFSALCTSFCMLICSSDSPIDNLYFCMYLFSLICPSVDSQGQLYLAYSRTLSWRTDTLLTFCTGWTTDKVAYSNKKSLEGRDWNRTENGIIRHVGREGVIAKVLVAGRFWGSYVG